MLFVVLNVLFCAMYVHVVYADESLERSKALGSLRDIYALVSKYGKPFDIEERMAAFSGKPLQEVQRELEDMAAFVARYEMLEEMRRQYARGVEKGYYTEQETKQKMKEIEQESVKVIADSLSYFKNKLALLERLDAQLDTAVAQGKISEAERKRTMQKFSHKQIMEINHQISLVQIPGELQEEFRTWQELYQKAKDMGVSAEKINNISKRIARHIQSGAHDIQLEIRRYSAWRELGDLYNKAFHKGIKINPSIRHKLEELKDVRIEVLKQEQADVRAAMKARSKS